MQFSRRELLAAAGVAPWLNAAEGPRPLLFISEAEGRRMRDRIRPEQAARFSKLADHALTQGPWSVTFHRPAGLNVDAGPNDYVSEGPYWWPDPNNPNGPYIRKDGQRNPGRFMGNRADLGNLATAVLCLGMGAFFVKKEGCAAHAGKLLSVWFLDAKTRMNSNLEHGQMVRGHNTGRGTGIIDTVALIHLAQGVVLLEAAGGMDAAIADGVRQWYGDYLHWMTTSRKGLDEKNSGNNHATWWTAQAAAYALFTGNAAAQKMAWEHYRNYLVPTEIQPDGSCPREEARTNSLSYSCFNLDAFSTLCRLAQMDGVDLWHFQTAKGIELEKCFAYLMPYVEDPAKWKKQQISPFSPSGIVFPAVAGLALPSSDMLAAWRRLPHGDSPWVQLAALLAE